MSARLSDITTILRSVLRDDRLELLPATRFEDLPDWNPVDLIAVVVEAENCFGIQFELPEIDRLSTVGDLLRSVASKQALATA